LKLLWLKRVKNVIAVSDAVRKACFTDATVIGNPYREALFYVRDDVERDRDFVFLGRLVSDKGADMAIQAIAELNTGRDRRVALTIIGEGPEQKNLEALSKRLGVESEVVFTGRLEGSELGIELNRHRYLWAPSRWQEPFGNVALEGMACGCIPLVSDGGGFPDAVGEAGLVFKRGDLSDMVHQSRRLLENEELQRQLQNAAPAHLDQHRPRRVAERYLECLEEAFQSA
jgi:glycosyltransferase involved in cell wall biosynthesis